MTNEVGARSVATKELCLESNTPSQQYQGFGNHPNQASRITSIKLTLELAVSLFQGGYLSSGQVQETFREYGWTIDLTQLASSESFVRAFDGQGVAVTLEV